MHAGVAVKSDGKDIPRRPWRLWDSPYSHHHWDCQSETATCDWDNFPVHVLLSAHRRQLKLYQHQPITQNFQHTTQLIQCLISLVFLGCQYILTESFMFSLCFFLIIFLLLFFIFHSLSKTRERTKNKIVRRMTLSLPGKKYSQISARSTEVFWERSIYHNHNQ